MALNFSNGLPLWSDEDRLRRAAVYDAPVTRDGQGRPITPSAAAPVANPTPEYADVTAYPNQINLDEASARRVFEPFETYIRERDDAGLDWMPLAAPMYEYTQTRDPGTGSYASRNLTADYSGMPQPLVDFAKFYAEPIQGRLTAEMGPMNRARDAYLSQNRIEHYFDPRTGVPTPFPFFVSSDARVGGRLTDRVFDPVYT